MNIKLRVTLIILCVITSLTSWVGWGVYTVHHAAEPLTFPYAVGTFSTILLPLLVALALVATGT